MSDTWAPLLPAALVGTDRHGAALPAWPGEVGACIANATAAAPDPATALLRTAAVLAACSAAGVQPAPFETPLPAPAAPDHLPPLQDPAALTAITWALREGPARLQLRCCAAMAAAGLRWPAALLPLVLDLGRRSLALRPLLLPTLGERGLWLAAQHEDWRYAAGAAPAADADTTWQEGSFEQRRALLAAERRRDPAAARERLAAALPELPAKERAELLAVLATELSGEDEALLDAQLQDRSREVRQAALALLLRLPASAHAHRAAERLAPLLTQERGLLGRRWVLEAPAQADDPKADPLLLPRPQHEALGERAWALYQRVRQVPLAWWTAHTGLEPAALLAWARKGDWHTALVRGWQEVLFAAPDTAWCEALLDHGPVPGLHHDAAALLALLPAAQRERHGLRQLRSGGLALELLLAQALAACAATETLSAELSQPLAEALATRAEAGSLAADYPLRSLLPELAAALHPAALPVLARIARRPDDPPAFVELLNTLAQTIATRQALLTLAPETAP